MKIRISRILFFPNDSTIRLTAKVQIPTSVGMTWVALGMTWSEKG